MGCGSSMWRGTGIMVVIVLINQQYFIEGMSNVAFIDEAIHSTCIELCVCPKRCFIVLVKKRSSLKICDTKYMD